MLLANELLVTLKPQSAAYRLDLLATALYMPIIMPILVLATSALGLTMAYVFGLIFALGILPAGLFISDLRIRKTPVALAVLAAALLIFLAVSLSRPNASANLQGKQNISRLPWDDALVYVLDAGGESEYRIYDLNAMGELRAFAPKMAYADGYYAAPGEIPVSDAIHSAAVRNVLTVTKTDARSLVYLTFSDIQADSFTIDDGLTSRTYDLTDCDSYSVTIHSDCAVTLNGGSAAVSYREVIRDHGDLIPAEAPGNLHFNLWLTAAYILSA